MSIPPTRPRWENKRQQGGKGGFLGFIGKSAWLAVVVFGVYYLMNQRNEEAAPPPAATNPLAQAQPPAAAAFQAAPSPSLSQSPSSDNLQNVELVTAASIQRQQLAGAKFKQKQAVANFEEIQRAIDEWEVELGKWEKVGPPLLQSDEGKKIAADANLVTRYRAVAMLERPSREAIAEARKQAEELITPIREASNNPEDAAAPEEKLTSALRELQGQARKARDSYRDARGTIDGLLAQAPGPGERMLEQAVATMDQEEAMKRADAIAAEEQKAKEEGTRLIAEAKKKLAQVEAESEANKIRELTERKRQGYLHAGSMWKGTRNDRGTDCPSTISIASREKDEVRGTLAWTADRQRHTVAVEGTVSGNVVNLKVVGIIENEGTSGQFYDLRFDPNAASLAGTYGLGGTINGTVGYRYERAER